MLYRAIPFPSGEFMPTSGVQAVPLGCRRGGKTRNGFREPVKKYPWCAIPQIKIDCRMYNATCHVQGYVDLVGVQEWRPFKELIVRFLNEVGANGIESGDKYCIPIGEISRAVLFKDC